jgi:hypothetical protein
LILNRVIDANYFRYVCQTTDGNVVDGLMEEASQNHIVLRLQNGSRVSLAREEIQELKATGVSLMPVGFEAQLSPESMNDLIAYIKNLALRPTKCSRPSGRSNTEMKKPMKIESVDFFYLSMPEVLDIGDGSQDALLVRIGAGGLEGWGECEASPLVSIASWICPMSHSACKPVSASVLGQEFELAK